MAYDPARFKTVAHYVCWLSRDNPLRLGATKLNKILWLCDFLSYYRKGKPLTGARYVRRQFGPVPAAIVPVIKDLESDGVLTVRETAYGGNRKREFTVLREPDLGSFSLEELDLIRKTTEFVCDAHTAKSISEMSHDHVWQAASDGEEIPYYTVFAVPDKASESDREWALEQLEMLSQ